MNAPRPPLITAHDRQVQATLAGYRERLVQMRRRVGAMADGTPPVPTPGFSCFGVTDYCMLRCAMCDKWHTDIFVEEKVAPALDQWKEALTSLRSIVPAGFEVDFGGGEALAHKGLLAMVRHAADLGLRTCLATNAWTINEALARRIADSGLSSIIISVDSLDPRIHDRFRGMDGVLEQARRAIEHLAAAAPELHIGTCTILMRDTIGGALEIAEWVNAHPRLKSALFMAVMQPNNTALDDRWYEGEHAALWPADQGRVQEVLSELIRMRKNGYYVGNTVPQLEAFQQYFADPAHFVKRTQCNMDRAVHVSAVGDVYLCFRKTRVGNLRESTDLAAMWRGAAARAAREDVARCTDNCHFLLNCFFEADYPFGYEPEHLKGLPPPGGPKAVVGAR